MAVEALGDVVLEVQNELDDTAGSHVARREIVMMAVARLQQLVETPATTDRVRRKHVLAHMQLGALHADLGERPQAHAEFLLGYDLAKRAVEANPASDRARAALLTMGVMRGESEYYFRENFPEAERLFLQAVTGFQELADKLRAHADGDPDLPQPERLPLFNAENSLADACERLSKVYANHKQLSKWDAARSVEWVKKSVAIRERLVAAKPTPDLRSRLAISYQHLGYVAFKENDLPGCIARYEEDLKQYLAILKDRPTSLKVKRRVADAEFRLGDVVHYVGQRERALELYTDGLKWAEQVRWSEPENPWYRAAVCQGHYCVATALPKAEREQALGHWREALKLREELYRELEAKGSVRHQDKIALGLTLARCGEVKRAAAVADALRPKADPRELSEEVASIYGLCMAAVQGDRALDRLTPEERKLRDHYQELALATLKEGVAKGFKGYIYLEGDADYEPLRALPEFRAWLAEYKKGLKQE